MRQVHDVLVAVVAHAEFAETPLYEDVLLSVDGTEHNGRIGIDIGIGADQLEVTTELSSLVQAVKPTVIIIVNNRAAATRRMFWGIKVVFIIIKSSCLYLLCKDIFVFSTTI